MTTIGLYFAGLDKEGTNALRARLNEIARKMGYTATRGPTTGLGNLVRLLDAIDRGEVALLLLDDTDILDALNHLSLIDEPWAQGIVGAIRDAEARRAEANWAEMMDGYEKENEHVE